MKPLLLFYLLYVSSFDPNGLSQDQAIGSLQDTLKIPGTKEVRGGGRGDGTGGGRGEVSKPKPLPQKIDTSVTLKPKMVKNSSKQEQELFDQLLNNAKSYQSINYDSGIYYAKEALTMSQQAASLPNEIKARELLVIYYAEVADAERGIKQGLALLSLVANQPEFNIAQSYRAMAMLSQVDKNYQQASAYWGKAIEAYTIKQDTIDIITTHIESGLFHDAIGEYETALEVLTTSLELSRAFGNYVAEHYILGSIGKVYTHLGDFDKAFDYLNQSLRLKQVYYRPVSVAYGFYDLQQAYLKAGKYKKSIEYGKSLQQTLNINPGTYLFKHSLEATRIASKALGREIPPLVDASKYPITDALNSHELLMQLRQMRALHSNEKTSEFIYEQQGSIGELKATTEFQKKAIYYGISVLMLLFGGAYMIRSRAFAIKEKNIQEEFSHQLLRYQEEERQRISRDLHDSIGQSLVLIKNKVQLNNDVDTSSLIANTLAEVRSISKQLHPVLLEKIGLTASLEKLMDEVDSNTEIFMETEIESIDNVFPKENELHIYRIIQEGINNMLKHANAVSAHFKIEHLNNEVRCSLTDRGSGFDLTTDPSKFQGLGMQTLKERTKILHGKLVLDSTKGKGTTLTLIVPKPAKP